MKKLLRFLILLLFVSSIDTTAYAMADQKGVHAEREIPVIISKSPYDLVYEINQLLQKKYSRESIVAALKDQEIVNRRIHNFENKIFHGWTALHLAVFKEWGPVVTILLDAGADVCATIGDHDFSYAGWTALHFAAIGVSDSETTQTIIKSLVNAGIHVDTKINSPNKSSADYHNYTSLHLAADRDKTVAVQTLLSLHARVNEKIDNPESVFHGWTALHLAGVYSGQATVQALIAGKADLGAHIDNPGDCFMHGLTPVKLLGAVGRKGNHTQNMEFLVNCAKPE